MRPVFSSSSNIVPPITGRLLAVAPQLRAAPGHAARGVVARALGHATDRATPSRVPSIAARRAPKNSHSLSVEGCQTVRWRSVPGAGLASGGSGTEAKARCRALRPWRRRAFEADSDAWLVRAEPDRPECCPSRCRSTVRLPPRARAEPLRRGPRRGRRSSGRAPWWLEPLIPEAGGREELAFRDRASKNGAWRCAAPGAPAEAVAARGDATTMPLGRCPAARGRAAPRRRRALRRRTRMRRAASVPGLPRAQAASSVQPA